MLPKEGRIVTAWNKHRGRYLTGIVQHWRNHDLRGFRLIGDTGVSIGAFYDDDEWKYVDEPNGRGMSEVSIKCDMCNTSGFKLEEITVALYPKAARGIYVCKTCAHTIRSSKKEYVALQDGKGSVV